MVIMYKIHGGSCRVDPWNEVMTGRRDRKMTGWTKGRREGVLLPLLLLCVLLLSKLDIKNNI